MSWIPYVPKLPLAIKPAVKENFFYATGAKAWRADTIEELRHLYRKAALRIAPQEILVQQIIPGDGCHQVSYCAFFSIKRPTAALSPGVPASILESSEGPQHMLRVLSCRSWRNCRNAF